ncbi:MAG: zf-HC2 domain-containing protein [Phycisphaerae bacterium]|nr:zf-HC2 domain-containing protein [Phycisphaerae bacterium]
MTCREIAQFLMQYTDGELPWRPRAMFNLHLTMCSACRRYLTSYELTVELARLSRTPDDEPVPASAPEELVRAILASRPGNP